MQEIFKMFVEDIVHQILATNRELAVMSSVRFRDFMHNVHGWITVHTNICPYNTN